MKEERKKFYYKSLGNKNEFERTAGLEADRRLMESYYPQKAGVLKALVTDRCDRLDYEGSFIYDEYPDKRNIERICQDICAQAQETMEVRTMEAGGDEAEGKLLGDFVGALLCQEIYQRRCVRKHLQQRDW